MITDITTTGATQADPGPAARPSLWGQLTGRLGRGQAALSNHVHAAADLRAREHGWEITCGTGAFGFVSRTYHDPRLTIRREAMVGVGYPVPTVRRPFAELARPASELTQ